MLSMQVHLLFITLCGHGAYGIMIYSAASQAHVVCCRLCLVAKSVLSQYSKLQHA